ncbi:MAG: hypothetical protein FJ054_09695 [Cyanobacteria bacterium M_surface_10_m2_119]|nr:hypothetical protein [Cyanobacteria bacterium M_surface_10_m2_119]
MPEASMRELVIHAGTHKTASSYIQSRLAANQEQLGQGGVIVRYPGPPSRKHKPLAAALAKERWPLWRRYLRGLPAETPRVLLSAEQFTQPLVRRRRLAALVELLEQAGFRLHVLCFLRDQPDYINARYVHSSRRLYHCQDFDTYVQVQLAERQHIYDYSLLFSPLLSHPGVRCTFLPYSSAFGDPFERMLEALGVTAPPQGWAAADPSKGNVQPGCRGVWLARAVGERLQALGVPGRALANTGAAVRRIAEAQGWQDDRYCGFDAAAAEAVSSHYSASNDAFAQRVWGCRWRDRVPVVPMDRRQYEPPAGGPEREALERLVDQALADLAAGNRCLAKALRNTPLTMTPTRSA